VSQPLPTAEIFTVNLGCSKPQCLGAVTVRCPYCATLHVHRVYTNDTIVFTRTAPCSTETNVRQYNVDLILTVPKRDVSHEHPVFEAGEDLDDKATRLSRTGLRDAANTSEQQYDIRPEKARD
jgi:hypothetical protein